MICAFSSLVELKDTVEKLGKEGNKLPNSEKIRACKVTQWAYDETGADVEESAFYTLSLTHGESNVKVNEDQRGFAELASQFPDVNAETIKTVWDSQNSWDACFSMLSSLLGEHQKLRVDSCNFLLSDIMWPALEVGETNDNNEWSVRELDISLAGLSLEIEKSKQITEGWHILDATDIPYSAVDNNSKSQVSYKDMVIRGEEAAKEIPALVPLKKASVAPWQPKFQVNTASKRRIDKVYMGNAPVAVQENDEDFDGGYFESQVFLKGSVGVTRKLAVTKIRPRAMDQKLKRIAEKVKA